MAKPRKAPPASNTPAPAAAAPDTASSGTSSWLKPVQPMLDTIAALPALVRTLLCVILVAILGYFNFVAGEDQPPYPFWDENYHMTSAQRYIDGIAHFEPHPPLGLMLIAVGEKLSGANANIDKQQLVVDKYINGDKMPAGFSFFGMRLMPSLFAAAAGLLFFGLMFSLTGNRLLALLFSTLYLFENAYIVHFRAVHLDSFQMFFCIAALWQFVRLWKREEPLRWMDYAGLGALCGLAIMVKINAALLLIMFPVLYFKDAFTQETPFSERPLDFLLKTGSTILAILVVFGIVFSLHTAIGTKMPDPASSAGKQDLENMSPIYKEYVTQGGAVTPGLVASVGRDYFKFMDKDHLGVPKLDVCKPGENGSHPSNWLWHHKTINYRWDSADGFTRYVQLAGNQFSWFLGLAAVIYSLMLIMNHRLNKLPVSDQKTYTYIELFTGLYGVFMLLHLYLGTQRVMYLYHYFIGLLITYILVVLCWQYLCNLHKATARIRVGSAIVLALCIIGTNQFFLPLTNHQPLTKSQCERRNIFSHIVDCQ
ncbi:phospholipid carrier-dependent glycosyltransferase [Viridibacterium curvum]